MTAELLKPPYPEWVDIGRCPDCGLDWRMSRSEYKFWVEKKIPLNMSLPKRCSDCRSARRKQQKAFGEKIRMQRKTLSGKLFNLAEEVKEGVYSDTRFELAMLLLGLSEEAEAIPEKFYPEKSHANKRPIQVHPRAVSNSPQKESGGTKALD